MRRTLWLWILTVTLFILIPGAVLARSESPAEMALSQTLVGRKALRRGDRGPAVEALQRLLRQRGFDPAKIDGIYGPLTERAVKAAQAALGLTADGLAGVQTTAALEAPVPVTADLFNAASGGPQAPSARLVVHEVAAPDQPAATAFALTFNGAPDPALLPPLLESLRRCEMKATFFVTGEAAEARPDLVAAIASAGHEVALNGPTQDPMVELNEREMRVRLTRAMRSVEAAAGKPAVHFRPPRGAISEALSGVARDLGLVTALWTNVAISDHPELTPQELAVGLRGAVYPGSVIMVHQDRPGTVAALEPFLKALSDRGTYSVTLSDLDRP
ncbi:MAG TPA: polysaccharide deacetylase family protein [Symbiobacteriaceae bacterium]|nr:polysaccharide deacetylase family protein [Symbiobacteriaceae bacterium]